MSRSVVLALVALSGVAVADRAPPPPIDGAVVGTRVVDGKLQVDIRAQEPGVEGYWVGVFTRDHEPIEGTEFRVWSAYKKYVVFKLETESVPSQTVRFYESNHLRDWDIHPRPPQPPPPRVINASLIEVHTLKGDTLGFTIGLTNTTAQQLGITKQWTGAFAGTETPSEFTLDEIGTATIQAKFPGPTLPSNYIRLYEH